MACEMMCCVAAMICEALIPERMERGEVWREWSERKDSSSEIIMIISCLSIKTRKEEIFFVV
jgi:hypothetical protein